MTDFIKRFLKPCRVFPARLCEGLFAAAAALDEGSCFFDEQLSLDVFCNEVVAHRDEELALFARFGPERDDARFQMLQ